eukprot:m.126597 g.126597  ORF g.126597 m.126597 type:complete len:89 (+) comp13837_c0_seq2:602-868(+)
MQVCVHSIITSETMYLHYGTCINPPMTPNDAYSDPSFSFVAMPGMMVWYGRLPGAKQFGCASSREKLSPLFCRVNPQPCGTIPEPNPM